MQLRRDTRAPGHSPVAAGACIKRLLTRSYLWSARVREGGLSGFRESQSTRGTEVGHGVSSTVIATGSLVVGDSDDSALAPLRERSKW